MRRVISPVGVIFKGSGWYITDNRRHIAGAGQPSLADKSAKDEAPAGAEEAPGSRSDEKGDSNGKDSTAKGAARGDTGKKGSGKREPAGGSSGKTTSKGR